MWYVNQKYNDLPLETIDEAETMPEASLGFREKRQLVYALRGFPKRKIWIFL